jgi:hypothetical protein
MKIELIEQVAQPVLYVRFTTSVDRLTEAFDKNFALIESYLTEIGEQPASAPYAAYYNHDDCGSRQHGTKWHESVRVITITP